MEAAWQRTRDAGIPFDAQWGDIDIMDRSNQMILNIEYLGDIDIMDRALDFTVNPSDFSGLSEFAHNLHEVDLSIFLRSQS